MDGTLEKCLLICAMAALSFLPTRASADVDKTLPANTKPTAAATNCLDRLRSDVIFDRSHILFRVRKFASMQITVFELGSELGITVMQCSKT